MTVREVLVKASDYLQLNDVKEYVLLVIENEKMETANAYELDEETQSQINILVDCLNNVLIDIATNYILLKKQETISVVDNVFNCQLLEKPIYKVLKVFDLCGDIEFQFLDNYLACKNGTCAIKYAYYPSEVYFISDVNTFDGKVSLLTFAYGIVREYCLFKGDYEQASMWDQKFQNNLLNSARKIKNVTIKRRRWA